MLKAIGPVLANVVAKAAPASLETVLVAALEQMLEAFSLETVGLDASTKRLEAKKAARDALAIARMSRAERR